MTVSVGRLVTAGNCNSSLLHRSHDRPSSTVCPSAGDYTSSSNTVQGLGPRAFPGTACQKGPLPPLSSEPFLPRLFRSSSSCISFSSDIKCLTSISQHQFSLKRALDVLLSLVLSHRGFPHLLREKAVSKMTLIINPFSSNGRSRLNPDSLYFIRELIKIKVLAFLLSSLRDPSALCFLCLCKRQSFPAPFPSAPVTSALLSEVCDVSHAAPHTELSSSAGMEMVLEYLSAEGKPRLPKGMSKPFVSFVC